MKKYCKSIMKMILGIFTVVFGIIFVKKNKKKTYVIAPRRDCTE